MGVKGLWQLVQPVARPIKLETLEGKRLAIDSSLWLYHFQMAMRDKEGRTLSNAHILGFLWRILKLLFYGIRPVFVFDGKAPVLKRRTLVQRKQRKEGALESHAKTAEKLLAAQLRQAALRQEAIRRGRGPEEEVIDESTVFLSDLQDPNHLRRPPSQTPSAPGSVQPSPSKPEKKKDRHKDPYYLPEMEGGITATAEGATDLRSGKRRPDPRLATEAELRVFIDEMRPEDFDIDSDIFRSLPTEVQYEVIGDLRLKSRQTSWKRLQSMLAAAPTALDFSKAQIRNLKQRNDLTHKLLTVTDMVGKANVHIPVRIAGERNKEYVLVRGKGDEGGWVLGVRDEGTKEKPVKVDTESESEGSEESEWEEMDEVPIPTAPRPPSPDPAARRRLALDVIAARYGVKEAPEPSLPVPEHARRPGEEPLFVPKRPKGKEVAKDREAGKETPVPQQQTQWEKDEAADLAHAIALSRGEAGLATAGDDGNNDFQLDDGFEDELHELGGDQSLDAAAGPAQRLPVDGAVDEAELDARLACLFKKVASGKGKAQSGISNGFGLGDEGKETDQPSILDDSLESDLEYVEIASTPPRMTVQPPHAEQSSGPSGRPKPMSEMIRAKEAESPALRAKRLRQERDRLEAEEKRDSFTVAKDDRSGRLSDGDQPEATVITDAQGLRQDRVVSEAEAAQDEPTLRTKRLRLEEDKVAAQTLRENLPSNTEFKAPVHNRDWPLVDEPRPVDLKGREVSEKTVLSDKDEDFEMLEVDSSEPMVKNDSMGDVRATPSAGAEDTEPMVPSSPPLSYQPVSPGRALNPEMKQDPRPEPEVGTNLPRMAPAHVADDLAVPAQDAITGAARGKEADKLAATNEAHVGVGDELQLSARREHSLTPTRRSTDGSGSPIQWPPSPSPDAHPSVGPDGFPLPTAEEIEAWDEEEAQEVGEEMEDERDEMAAFLSKVRNRDLDEVQMELEDEVRVLKQQHATGRRAEENPTEQMAREIQMMLRLFGLPYMTAPQEAEAQCAELVSRRLVDGIITDDSDVFLFGGTRIYKNMFNQNKIVECFLLSDLDRELGLDREKLVRLAYLLGSDYVDGLPGVGPVLAMELMGAFSGEDGLLKFKDWWMKVQMGRDTIDESGSKSRRRIKKALRNKVHLSEDWPNPAVLDAYYSPTVDESDEPFQWGFPDLDSLRHFLMEYLRWSITKTDQYLLPVMKRMGERGKAARVQSTLDRNGFFDTTAGTGVYAGRKRTTYASNRLQEVVESFRHARQGRLTAPSPTPGAQSSSKGGQGGQVKSKGKARGKNKSKGKGKGKGEHTAVEAIFSDGQEEDDGITEVVGLGRHAVPEELIGKEMAKKSRPIVRRREGEEGQRPADLASAGDTAQGEFGQSGMEDNGRAQRMDLVGESATEQDDGRGRGQGRGGARAGSRGRGRGAAAGKTARSDKKRRGERQGDSTGSDAEGIDDGESGQLESDAEAEDEDADEYVPRPKRPRRPTTRTGASQAGLRPRPKPNAREQARRR